MFHCWLTDLKQTVYKLGSVLFFQTGIIFCSVWKYICLGYLGSFKLVTNAINVTDIFISAGTRQEIALLPWNIDKVICVGCLLVKHQCCYFSSFKIEVIVVIEQMDLSTGVQWVMQKESENFSGKK